MPKKNHISAIVLIVCYLVMTYTAFVFYPKWEKQQTEATLSWDVSGYYFYLPATFIYKDLKHCNFKDKIIEKYHPTPAYMQGFLHKESGNYVMKYSSGQALVMLPFFAVGHLWASNSSAYVADGFSFPYQISIGIGMFLVALLGLFLLRKVLLYYYEDIPVAILLFSYVVGTNYLNYTAIDQAMTHNSLFTIYTFLLYATHHFYENPRPKWALAIGICVGWAALIRPTDLLSVLIPLAWGLSHYKEIPERISFLLKQHRNLLLALLGFACFAVIQPIYWKYVTGDWVVYSYEDQGFSWLHPHVKDYTFSYRCGWLRYCPMMVLPFVGIFPYLHQRKNLIAVLGFFLLNFYVVTAWDVWDYGGTAGRAMVQSYPILAFPFLALITYCYRHRYWKYVFYPLWFLLIYLNIWWTYHAHKGDVQVSESSHHYYWRMVGRWKADDYDKKLLDNRHSYRGIPTKFEVIYENGLEQDSAENIVLFNNSRRILLDKTHQHSPLFRVAKPEKVQKWMRISADVHCVNKEWDLWKQTQFIVKFYQDDQEVQSNLIRLQRFIHDGQDLNLFLDARTPKKEWNNLRISFWNADSDKAVYIDNLRVITFEEENNF